MKKYIVIALAALFLVATSSKALALCCLDTCTGAASCTGNSYDGTCAEAQDLGLCETTTGCCIKNDGSGSCIDAAPTTPHCDESKYTYNPSSCSSLSSQCSSPTPSGSTQTIEFNNPLQYETVTDVLFSLLKNLQGIIVTLAVVFIVLAGIIYMLSSGNEKRVGIAKGMFTGAIIGFAIALAAPTFLKEIMSILGGEGGADGSADAWVDEALTLKDIALNVLKLLLALIGTIGIISLVIAGMMYFTAAGDEKRIDTAKAMTKYAIVGIVVSFSALVVLNQIAKLIVGE